MNKETLVNLHQSLSGYHDFLFGRYRDPSVPEMQDVKHVLELVEKIVAEIPGPIVSNDIPSMFPPAAGGEGASTAVVNNFANMVVSAPKEDLDHRAAFMRLGEMLAKETPMNMGYVLLAKEKSGILYYVSTFSPNVSTEIMQEFIRNAGTNL